MQKVNQKEFSVHLYESGIQIPSAKIAFHNSHPSQFCPKTRSLPPTLHPVSVDLISGILVVHALKPDWTWKASFHVAPSPQQSIPLHWGPGPHSSLIDLASRRMPDPIQVPAYWPQNSIWENRRQTQMSRWQQEEKQLILSYLEEPWKKEGEEKGGKR